MTNTSTSPVKAPRILLSTVVRPFALSARGDDMMDCYSSRFTKNQDVFTFESTIPYMAIHLIAKNIRAETVCLESPSLEEFDRELEHGYDFVGIGFVNRDVDRVFDMARLVRRKFPGTRIVLGGYGVMCMESYLEEHGDYVKLFDHVCRGEGVRFFRELLGQSVEDPIDLVIPPNYLYPFRIRAMRQSIGVVLGGLGCKRRCEFCNTAAFYGRYVKMATGRDVYEAAKRYVAMDPAMKFVTIYDEDFLQNEEAFAELCDLMAKDTALLEKVGISLLTSIDHLSKMNIPDLVRSGVGAVWLGVESFFSKMGKLRGRDVQELFDELHSHGINTTGSFILGLDCQTPENIEEDVDRFIALQPTMAQVTCLVPGPGTTLWDRLIKEDRLRHRSWSDHHMYAESMTYKGFAPEEILDWVNRAYTRNYEREGSGVLRHARVALNGYRFCKGSKDPALQARARFYEEACTEGRPSFLGMRLFAPNPAVAAKVREVEGAYNEVLGGAGLGQRFLAAGLVVWLCRNWVWDRMKWHSTQPTPVVSRYDTLSS